MGKAWSGGHENCLVFPSFAPVKGSRPGNGINIVVSWDGRAGERRSGGERKGVVTEEVSGAPAGERALGQRSLIL